ncbi:unnamed protein product [Mycena citricolor]|uniref:Uncharacterized protein n=1 Tax=Mycena citricolor TaxID=2018698 RepID=A0AAD2Q4C8_9AGAR|nr:unnamed protein product [Mycena citricolor]
MHHHASDLIRVCPGAHTRPRPYTLSVCSRSPTDLSHGPSVHEAPIKYPNIWADSSPLESTNARPRPGAKSSWWARWPCQCVKAGVDSGKVIRGNSGCPTTEKLLIPRLSSLSIRFCRSLAQPWTRGQALRLRRDASTRNKFPRRSFSSAPSQLL